MQGRFFRNNWRPPADDIRFAAESGFTLMQFRNDRHGDLEAELRTPLEEVAEALARHRVEPTMEIFVRVAENAGVIDALLVNLPAIRILGCERVHFHLVLAHPRSADVAALEHALVPQLARAAGVARDAGLTFGFEHNSQEEPLFARPEACARALDAAPDLGFVWDVNHTAEDDLDGYAQLLDRAMLVHASDARLPETNHHLPLGEGAIDFRERLALLARAEAPPIVLEIGGLPRSGGVGRDTDEALQDSRARLLDAWPA